jgi:hypothetical protein
MNTHQGPHPRRYVFLAVAALFASASMGARGEYLCAAPKTAADTHACQLAKLDRPDELRHFIQRTQSVYGLYMPDYVRDADFERWDRTRQRESARNNQDAEPGQPADQTGAKLGALR